MLKGLSLFLRIIEKGSMAAAGREMGLSPATVSERVAALETYYGARLLTRTTRSISLTDEGRILAKGAKRLLAEAEEIEMDIKHGVKNLSGTLRLSAPVDLGRNRIAPILDRFLAQNPDIKIDLILTDGYVDMVAQGIDLALRFGALADSTLRTKSLGRNRRVVCASPEYLKAHGTPARPEELAGHNCILMRFGNKADNQWAFAVDGKKKNITVRGNRIVNDGHLLREWCIAGKGIALKSIWDVNDDLNSGRLVEVLKPFAAPPSILQIVYPSGSILPRRVTRLIEVLSAELSLQ